MEKSDRGRRHRESRVKGGASPYDEPEPPTTILSFSF